MRIDWQLSGQVAIVTGGGHGIGAAIARVLAQSGASVAVWDNYLDERVDRLLAELRIGKGQASAHLVDVSSAAAVNQAMEEVIEHYGRLDIVVNDAGICPFEDLAHLTDALWNSTLGTNLSGPFFVARAALPYFARHPGGSIVNISTVSTHIATPHQVHYIASKAGLDGLTRALAVAFSPYHIRVNAVAPGGVATDINRDADAQAAAWARSGVPPGGPGRELPIGRPATPDDIAQAVAFLASDAARYITGVVLPVDGGALIV